MYRVLRWITIGALIAALLLFLNDQPFMAMILFMLAALIFAAVTASLLKDTWTLLDNHHQQLKAQAELNETLHSSLNDVRELLGVHQRWLESVAPELEPPLSPPPS